MDNLPSVEQVEHMAQTIRVRNQVDREIVVGMLSQLGEILRGGDAGKELKVLCDRWQWNTHSEGPLFREAIDLARRFAARLGVLEARIKELTPTDET